MLSLALAAAAGAEIQIKVLADGTKLIYNENETQKARRTATTLLPVPTSELRRWIDHHAGRQGLSPRLVRAVVQVESGYNPRALSHRGALGLMQLMPETARELRVDDPYDPEQNIRGGTTYLRRMVRRYSGNLRLALAAYNAGPTAVDRHGGMPPYRETRDYVQKVLDLYHYGTTSPGPSPLVREHARDLTEKRAEEERRAAAERRGGDPVYMTRDENGRIVVTTTSPKSN